MYIHLGGDKLIQTKDLIAIFDLTIEKSSKISKDYLQHAREFKKTDRIGSEESKTIVLTTDKIYYSPVSSSTLKKRANQYLSD